jgi:CheY-like chemotaxis protein
VLPLVAGPLETMPLAEQLEDTVLDDATSFRGTVLYIEDNASNLRLVERVVKQRSGVRLLAAVQGASGLEMARQQKPDLILLDLHLPDMSGDEVLRHLRQHESTRDIPVAVISADATAGRIQRLLDAGVNHYLTKPLDVGQFLQLLDNHWSPADQAGTDGAPIAENKGAAAGKNGAASVRALTAET